MKKLSLTIAMILMVTTATFSNGRYNTFFFRTLDGLELKLRVAVEEEIDEPLPFDTYEVFKSAKQEELVGFNGFVFDLTGITVPEQDFEESINIKAIFQQLNGQTGMSVAK